MIKDEEKMRKIVIITICIIVFVLLLIWGVTYYFYDLYLPYKGPSNIVSLSGDIVINDTTVGELKDDEVKVAIYETNEANSRVVYIFDKEIANNIVVGCRTINSTLLEMEEDYKRISLKITIEDEKVVYKFKSTYGSEQEITLPKEILYVIPCEGVYEVKYLNSFCSLVNGLMGGRIESMPPYVFKFTQIFNQELNPSRIDLLLSSDKNQLIIDSSAHHYAESYDTFDIENGTLQVIK